MKRIHWWTLLGVSGAGLAALILGQTVLGQPEAKGPPVILVEPVAPAKEGGAAAPQLLPIGTPGVVTGSEKTEVVIPTGPATPRGGNVSLDVQPGKQQPALTIEWGGPSTIRINQPMSCQIIVRNASTTPAQNVVVRHRLAQGVTCKGSEPTAILDAGEMVWNLGTLPPEQARRIDLTLLSQNRGPLNCHATVTFTGVAAYQVQVREPQLAVKLTSPDRVIAGENVTLLFDISNPGDGVAEAVKIKTVLPEGFEHPRGKFVDFEVGNLGPKERKLLQLVCVAKGAGPQKCNITISGEGGLTASDASQVDILTPKLGIAMTGPKLRYLDRHATYTLKVSNPGSAPASNVEVQEQVPPGFKFHQATAGGKFHELHRLVSWNIGDLQPGQSKDIAVELIPIETGDHRLVALAKGGPGLRSEADARTVVEGLPALFIEVGHLDDPIEVGAETAYEIRVVNTGTKMETNIEVVCTLPEQLEFRGAQCNTKLSYRQHDRDLIFEPVARLAPRADVTYRVQVKGTAPGDIRFRTRIKSDSMREPVLREEPTRIYSDEMPVRSGTSLVPTPVVPTPAPKAGPTMITPTPRPNETVPAPLPAPTIPAPKSSEVVIPAPKSVETMPAPLPTIPTPKSTERAPMPTLPAPKNTAPTPLPTIPAPKSTESSLPAIPAPRSTESSQPVIPAARSTESSLPTIPAPRNTDTPPENADGTPTIPMPPVETPATLPVLPPPSSTPVLPPASVPAPGSLPLLPRNP
jgi:uncharacterized repeat protein (TIGR01451 family)